MFSMQQIFLLDILLLAAYFDVRYEKIPNWLCLGGSLCGLVTAGVQGGLTQIALQSIPGGLCPILLLGVLFRLRLMGAGDIKLLAMLGFWMDGRRSITCIGASILWCGAMAILRMIRKRRWISRIGMAPAILAGYVTVIGGDMIH